MSAIIDNDIYNRDGDQWRNEAHYLNLLDSIIQPIRFNYLQEILHDKFTSQATPRLALDVGCGGGFMAEALAVNFKVTGLDQSETSLQHARQHAQDKNLSISYLQGRAEYLPFPEQSFDLVCVCDVLEHVNHLEKTISEAGRVLKPGGIVFFDTINRTLLSRLSIIHIAQENPLTSFMGKDVHVWNKFIKPKELENLLTQAKLKVGKFSGIAPIRNPASLFMGLMMAKLRHKRGSQLASLLKLRQVKSLAAHYMGYAIKEGQPHE